MKNALQIGLRVFAVVGLVFVTLIIVGFPGASEKEESILPDERQEARAIAPRIQHESAAREADDEDLERTRQVRIKRDLARAFAAHESKIVGKVGFEVEAERVLLHGAVNSQNAVREAGEIASSISDGMPIENNIIVKNISPKWNQRPREKR